VLHDDTALAPTQSPEVPRRPHGELIPLEMRTSVLPRAQSQVVDRAQGPRFEPMRVIGRGGLGEVTLVRDHDIDRPVAIKRLRGASSDDQVMRFAHEVRTVGRLEHPNIAPVYDVGVEVTLKGSTYALRVPVTVKRQQDAIVASGEFGLKQTQLGLKPFTAAMGALLVLDDMRVRFDITARAR
jgi:hypothetical protein